VVVPQSAAEIHHVVVVPDYVTAPVIKGQKVGTVAFYSGDTLMYEVDIVTKSEVDKTDYFHVLKKMFINLLTK